MSSERSLPNMIKDITLYYIKFYYTKHLDDNHITYIEEEDLKDMINNLYVEKKQSLKDYIRKTLKKEYGENYPNIQVENILLEMFDNPELAKNRVITEIMIYQKNKMNN
tara:strand:+ start:81 stop:407 length:327 start_codon:yes stop_codon:yes gene_type:complete